MSRPVPLPRLCGVLGFFAACVLGTGGYDLFRFLRDGPPPLARDPGIAADLAAASIEDGEYALKFGLLLARSSPTAVSVRPYYGAALIGVLKATPVMTAVGREGMMFPTRPPSYRHEDAAVVAAQIAPKVAAVARRFAERGVRVLFCPVALKGIVCEEFAPAAARGRPELHRATVAAVARAGVAVVDTLETLRAAWKSGVRVYPNHDGHWTAEGAIAAAEAVAAAAGMRADPASRRSRLVPKGTIPDVGSELATSGIFLADVVSKPAVRRWLELVAPLRELPLFSLVDEKGEPFPVGAMTPDAAAVIAGTSYSVDHELSSPGFGAYVAHALDRPVRVLAMRGAGPAAPLWGAVQIAAAVGHAPLLIWEMPGIDLFDAEPLPNLGMFFAVAPPTAPRLVLDAAPVLRNEHAAPVVGTHRLRRETLTARLPRGLLAHDGRGAVTLEITGEVLSGDVYVEVDGGGVHEAWRWAKGPASVWLPVLATEPTDSLTLRLYADDAEVRVASVRLFGDTPADGAVVARPGKPEARPEGRFAAAAAFAAGTAVAPRDVVEVRLRTPEAGGGPLVEVALEMVDDEGGVARYDFPRLEAGATLILDPTSLPPLAPGATRSANETRPASRPSPSARRPLAAIRVVAKGAVPEKSPLAAVRLLRAKP